MKNRHHPQFYPPGDPHHCSAPHTEWRVIDYQCNYSAFSGSRYTKQLLLLAVSTVPARLANQR